jgi:hypothetical protein
MRLSLWMAMNGVTAMVRLVLEMFQPIDDALVLADWISARIWDWSYPWFD